MPAQDSAARAGQSMWCSWNYGRAIDEDAIFYLVSRGVPRKKAQDMLVLAFLAEAIDEIDSNDLADDINDRLAAWMNRR